jgi:glycosyltransferase involved in cell wall biosynthesis
MKKTTLAIIILTYNEEKNIKLCINSAQFADEIILIDSGSTDKTKTIAENLGAKVYEHSMDEAGFAGQRNFALEKTQADWVFYLDADERLTPQLAKEIETLILEAPCCYKIKRVNYIFGQRVVYGGHSPDYIARLFPQGKVKWSGIVHERALSDLPIKKTKGHICHYTYTSWEMYFEKFNKYTTLMAKKMHDSGKKATLADILLRPCFAFIKYYILNFGFLDGFLGFAFSVMNAFYTLAKYLKLKYYQENQPLE